MTYCHISFKFKFAILFKVVRNLTIFLHNHDNILTQYFKKFDVVFGKEVNDSAMYPGEEHTS